MTEREEDFAALVRRVQDGSDEAARELIDRYGQHILRVVRRRLSKQLRSKFDSVDFVQSVWASVFADRAALAQIDRPEALVAFLATLAHHKVVEQTQQRFRTGKRNIDQERRLDDVLAASGHEAVPGADATPSQVAVANELWDRMIQGQPSQHQKILDLRRLGNTYAEIAAKLGLNEKTVRRVLNRALSRQQP
jgi:RNA polymerase sigma-70 factor (ECF subfamily)